MTMRDRNYKGLIIVLAFLLAALFIYVNRPAVIDDKKEKDERDKKVIDSLGKVNGELLKLIEEQRRREGDARERFRKETEKMKKEYDKKIRDLSDLSSDEHVRFLSRELSEKD